MKSTHCFSIRLLQSEDNLKLFQCNSLQFSARNLIVIVMFLGAMQTLGDRLFAQSRSDTIAMSGQSAPDGNGSLSQFFSASLNSTGQVAFDSTLTSTIGGNDDNRGIFRGDGNGLVQIAREGQTVLDGNGNYAGFFSPFLNELGQVAFDANLSATIGGNSDNSGLFRGSGGGIIPIARAGQLAPDGNGIFSSTALSSFNDLGQVAFRASFTGTSGGSTDDGGVFLGNGSSISQIAREGQSAPNGNGSYSNLSSPVTNNAGQVAFQSVLTGTSGGATDNNGVFRFSGGSISQIARAGEPAPDTIGTFSEFSAPHMNDAGQVAFRAALVGTTNNSGIFLGSGGSLTQIVREGQFAPDSNGNNSGLFFDFLNPALNSIGQVAFEASLVFAGSGNSGIFRGNGNSITQIGRRGELAPGGNGQYATFGAPSINASGQVAFVSSLSGTSGGSLDDRGIFTSDGTDTLKVVREGDSLEGSFVTSLTMSPRSLNNFGQVAYTAFLANGSELVSLWTPELHWRNSGDGAWDSGDNWTLGLNPAEVHDVFIDSDSNVVVAGPSNDANVRNLTVGGGSGAATLVLDGSELAISAGSGNSADILSSGVLAGTGQINGLTRISGQLSPGSNSDTTGKLSFQGELRLDSDAITTIELGGLAPSDFDSFSVLGNTVLGGNLSVALINGFSLSTNDSFLIGDLSGNVTGQFIGLGEGDLVGNFGGRDLFITYAGGNGSGIALFTAVPEPSSGTMLVGLAVGCLIRRRRYRQSVEATGDCG